MRILLITNMYPSKERPYQGIFVQKVDQKLEEKGADIERVVIGRKGPSLINYLWWWLKVWVKLLFLYRKFDVVYCHFVKYSMVPFIILPKVVLNKTVFNFHGTDLYSNRIFHYFMKKVLEKSGKIISPSLFFSTEITRILEIERHQIIVSPSGGVDTKLFFPVDIDNNPVVLGYVSNIVEDKGWDIFLRSISELKSKGFKFTARIIGSGPDSSQLTQMIEDSGLEEYTKYLGRKTGLDLVREYQHMDIFVFPSKRESLGLVGIEAMSCGVPVIGSDIGGIKSYLQDGYNGYLFEPGDSKALSSALGKWFRLSSSNKNTLKQNARETALKNDTDKIIDELYYVFQEIT